MHHLTRRPFSRRPTVRLPTGPGKGGVWTSLNRSGWVIKGTGTVKLTICLLQAAAMQTSSPGEGEVRGLQVNNFEYVLSHGDPLLPLWIEKMTDRQTRLKTSHSRKLRKHAGGKKTFRFIVWNKNSCYIIVSIKNACKITACIFNWYFHFAWFIISYYNLIAWI